MNFNKNILRLNKVKRLLSSLKSGIPFIDHVFKCQAYQGAVTYEAKIFKNFAKTMFILLIMSVIILGCTHNPYSYIDVIDKITERKASQICRNEKLKVMATGGAMMDSITRVTIRFASYGKELDLAEARRLYVRCMEELRNEINSHEELIPFLNPYPFPVSGMDIGFMIFDKQGNYMQFGWTYLGKGGVSAISQHNGMIFYGSYNPKTEKLEPFYEEPYEVALAIVRGEIPAPEIECSAALE